MKIAVDLDGVVFQFLPAFLEFVKTQTGRIIPIHSVRGWNFLTDWGFTEAEDKQLLHDFCLDGGYLRTELIPGARYNLYKLLHDLKHEIIFITSRPAVAMIDTFQMLEKHGLGGFQIHFSDKVNTKGTLVKQLECDILIEDRWEYLAEAKKLNHDLILILFNYEKQLEPPSAKDLLPLYAEDWDTVVKIVQEQ